MKYLKLTIAVLILVASPVALSIAQASTTLEDFWLDQDTTLSASDSPFIIKGWLNVPEGVTLTIEPGVELRFSDWSYLQVSGQLMALGTEAAPIYFRSEVDPPADLDPTNSLNYGSWGVAFYADPSGQQGQSKLSWVDFSGSYQGLFLSEAKVQIEHSRFSQLYAGFWSYFSELSFQDTIFLKIESDAVSGEGGSLVVASTSVSQIGRGDAFGGYNQAKLSFDRVRVSDIGYGSAIGLYGSTAEVADSIFVGGQDSAIELYRGRSDEPSVLKMHKSSVVDFAGYGLFVDGGCQAEVVSNWWGHRSGPFEFEQNFSGEGSAIFVESSPGVVPGEALFIPWLKKDPTKSRASSVAFIPGIQASRLYEKGFGALGSLFENQLWEPNRNSDVEKLFLDDAGKSLASGIYTRDIIDQVNILRVGPNIYKNLISFFDEMVTQGELTSWQAFPYDWRLDLEDLLPDLVQKLSILVAQSGSGADSSSITLVAHSNGGLVAKWLLYELQRLKDLGESDLIDSIDKLVLVATPQLGTPKAIMAMLHGDEQGIAGGLILKPWLARAFSEHMPGAYHLLPSAGYFASLPEPVIRFASSTQRLGNFSVYQGSIKSAFDLGRFLTGNLDHRSSPEKTDTDSPAVLSGSLLEKSSGHHDILDTFLPADISVAQIVGWGIDTVKAVTYSVKKSCTLPPTPFTGVPDSFFPRAKIHLCNARDLLVRTPVFTEDGDKTVVSKSAVGALVEGGATTAQTFFVDLRSANASSSRLTPGRSHADIFEVPEVRETLKVLLGEDLELPPHVSVTNPSQTDKAQRLIHFRASVHSPVTIDLFDSQGNHTGQATSSPAGDFDQIEEQVPGSSYQAFGEDKYISFASNDFWDYGERYRLILSGIGYGVFTFEFEEIQNDRTIRQLVFVDVPVTPKMRITLDFSTFDEITELPIDVDGNGTVDERVRPGGGFDGQLYLQTLRRLIASFCMVERQRQAILLQIDRLSAEIAGGDVRGLTGKLQEHLIVSELSDLTDVHDLDSPELVGEMIAVVGQLLTTLD